MHHTPVINGRNKDIQLKQEKLKKLTTQIANQIDKKTNFQTIDVSNTEKKLGST